MNKNIIAEAVITVPPSVLEPIRRFIKDVHYQVYMNDWKRIPPNLDKRRFILDFRNTKYPFLQRAAEKYPLVIQLGRNELGDDVYYDGANNNAGRIKLNIFNSASVYTSDLAHEIVHYIQHLMAKNRGEDYWENTKAGLGKKKFRDKRIDPQGHIKRSPEPKKNLGSVRNIEVRKYIPVKGVGGTYFRRQPKRGIQKRIAHPLRPIEHHSNIAQHLHTLIRKSAISPESPKKNIFIDYVSSNNSLQTLKKKNPEAYKNAIRLIYSNFMDSKPEIYNTFKDYTNFLKSARLDKLKQIGNKIA